MNSIKYKFENQEKWVNHHGPNTLMEIKTRSIIHKQMRFPISELFTPIVAQAINALDLKHGN